MNSTGECAQDTYSKEIENNITACIEHFDYDDAIILCQAYFNKVRNERSLYLLAKCFFLSDKPEMAYSLLKCVVFESPNCRYLCAKCAFLLGRFDECETQLRDDAVTDRIELHPCFNGSSTLPFAHSLLAKNLRMTNRMQVAMQHFQKSLKRNCTRWSVIKEYCDVGGEKIAETCSKTLSDAVVNSTTTTATATATAPVATTIVTSTVKTKKPQKELRVPRRRRLLTAQNQGLINSDDLVEPMDLENADPIGGQSKTTIGTMKIMRFKRDKISAEIGAWLVQMAQAQEHLSHFRCADALAVLDALDIAYAKLPLSMELRARVYFESGEYARCCDACEELRQLYPRRHQAMEIYSTSLWQIQDAFRLSALCSEMVTMARDEPESWCVAGNCFSLEKQHDTAVECLERATRLNPRFGYAYSLLGHELIILNDLTRAEAAFQRAIGCTPNDYRPWYGLGLVYYKLERLAEAKPNLMKAVQINPTNIVVLCQLSVIEQSLCNNEKAMQHLNQALQYAPNNVACLYHKARLLFDTGHYEASMSELKKLMSLSPDEAHVFYLLGRVYRRLGDHHMALLSYSWATEIDPRGEQNHSALSDQGPYDDDPVDLSETSTTSAGLHNMSDSSIY